MAEGNMISLNVPNVITIGIAGLLGWALVALVWRLYKQQTGARG